MCNVAKSDMRFYFISLNDTNADIIHPTTMEPIAIMEKFTSDEDLAEISNELHTIAKKTHNKYPLLGGAATFIMLTIVCCCGYCFCKPLSIISKLTSAFVKNH